MRDGVRTVVVTGGSRGIGAATAALLAERGWDVVITYRDREDDAAAVVAACTAHGRRALAVAADLARPDAVDTMWAEIDRQVGPIDALVNNAGIVSPSARVEGYDAERLRRIFDLNVIGAFLVAAGAVRRLSTAHGGAGGVIVNVSSRAAQLGSADEYVDYAASKAALDTFTVGLANEVAGDGIRVVAVRPGLIETEIHEPGRLDRLGSTPPLGRPGTAREVAAAIAWLLSGEASYVTGALLDVGGGR